MHHNRHKEILTLVRKINALDDINKPNPAGPDSPSLGKSYRSSATTTSIKTTTDTSSEIGEETPKMKKSERKKAKKLGLGPAHKKRKVEAFAKEDIDYISEAIHLTIHETKGGWEGSYIYNKQLDVEQPIPEIKKVKDIIDHTANLSVKVPSTPSGLTPRQRKCVKKFSTPVRHAGYLGGSRKYSANSLSNGPLDGVDPKIFFRLGIEVMDPPKNSVARKDLVAKLITAVKSDLAIITQEETETEMRAEGFWRWAGKGAYDEIMKRREKLDWVSTCILPECSQNFPGFHLDQQILNLMSYRRLVRR